MPENSISLITPSWFAQRQGKAEPAGENCYRLTAPNMKEAFIGIRADLAGGWIGFLRQTADSPSLDTSPGSSTTQDAWAAAFELYRIVLVV
jgi:hypothetical protein